jgi:hypothetical protein
VTYSVTYIATGSGKAAQGAGLSAALFMGIGELRGGKMGANGKMQYNPGWESVVGHTLYRSCVSTPSHQYAHDL